MNRKQINVEVEAAVADHIRKQPHQGRYLEELVRRDMGVSESLEARVERLEQRLQRVIDEQNAQWAKKNHIMTPQFKAEKDKIVRK